MAVQDLTDGDGAGEDEEVQPEEADGEVVPVQHQAGGEVVPVQHQAGGEVVPDEDQADGDEESDQGADGGSSSAVRKKGRPAPLVKLEGKDRVAFSRWCKKESLELKCMDPGELQEVKASWMTNPDAAKSRILSSSSGQKTMNSSKEKDLWYTTAKIASSECLAVDSEELQSLLQGLRRRKSRYPHLRDQQSFDEFEYHDFHAKVKSKSRFVETAMNMESDELASKDAKGAE